MQLWHGLSEIIVLKCLVHYKVSRECWGKFAWLLYNLSPRAGIHVQNLILFKNPLMGSSLPGDFSVFLLGGQILFIWHTFVEHLPYAKCSYIETTLRTQQCIKNILHVPTHTFVCLFACLVIICFGCAGPSLRHLGPVVAMPGPRCSM